MAIVTVKSNTYTVESLYQWDVNQVLEIYGLSLPSVPEIHFTNDAMDRAIVRQATVNSAGVISANIPNSLLQKPYKIKAYVCIYEGDTFESLYKIEIPVKARNKPSDYTIEGDEEIYSFNALENQILNILDNVTTAVNTAKEAKSAAATATSEAKAAKSAVSTAQQTAEDGVSKAKAAQGTADAAVAMAKTAQASANTHAARHSINGEDPLSLADIGGSNPNLLDNWYFGNPVNQRGQTEYTGTGYGIDRWRTNYSGDTVSITESGVKNTVASTSEGWHLHQILTENISGLVGQEVTASVLVDSYEGSNLIPILSFRNSAGEISSIRASDMALGLLEFSGVVPAGTTEMRFGLFGYSGIAVGEYVTLKAAKLELGSVSTLKNDPPPDFGQELAKSQRYQVVINVSAAWANVATAVASETNYLRANMPTPVTMRAVPAVTLGAGTKVMVTGEAQHFEATSETIEAKVILPGAVAFAITNITAAALTKYGLYAVQAYGGLIILDANL